MYSVTEDSLYVPYSCFTLEHCLAHGVHVYNPSCLAQSRQRATKHHRIIALVSPPFLLAFVSRHSSRSSDIAQAARAEPSRIPSAYTHTLTLTLTLTPSLSHFSFPAGVRAINNRQSTTPSIQSYLFPSFRTHKRGPSVCHTPPNFSELCHYCYSGIAC